MRVPRKPAGRWSRWALGTGLSLACFLCLGLGLPHWTRERTRRFWQAPRARRWGAAWGCVGLLPRLQLGHGARWARSPASLADHSLRRQALYDAGDVGYFHLRVTWLPCALASFQGPRQQQALPRHLLILTARVCLTCVYLSAGAVCPGRVACIGPGSGRSLPRLLGLWW